MALLGQTCYAWEDVRSYGHRHYSTVNHLEKGVQRANLVEHVVLLLSIWTVLLVGSFSLLEIVAS
jgi:hypothetical protein